MSKFLCEMKREAEVRVDQYERERAELLKASDRISELDGLIAEAKAEIASLCDRLPKED